MGFNNINNLSVDKEAILQKWMKALNN